MMDFSFDNLASETLDMTAVSVEEFENCFTSETTLKNIKLNLDSVKKIDNSFNYLRNLKKINWVMPNLKNIVGHVFSSSGMSKINLVAPKLETIEMGFANVTKHLTEFSLSAGNLKSIGDRLFIGADKLKPENVRLEIPSDATMRPRCIINAENKVTVMDGILFKYGALNPNNKYHTIRIETAIRDGRISIEEAKKSILGRKVCDEREDGLMKNYNNPSYTPQIKQEIANLFRTALQDSWRETWTTKLDALEKELNSKKR